MTPAMNPEERLQRRSSARWLGVLVVTALLVVMAAVQRGKSFSVAWGGAVFILALFGALGIAFARSLRRPEDHRLANAAGSLLTLFVAGAAGGVVSLVGQTFAFPLIDAPLAAADQAMGASAIDIVRAVVAVPLLPEVLHLAYFTTVPLIFLSALALAVLGRGERVWELCAAFCFCMLVATLCSLFLPAAAPFEYLGMPAELRAELPDHAGVYHVAAFHELRATRQFEVDCFELQGVVTFPSFHTAMAAITAAAWRDDRRLRWPMLGFNLVVILSTVPIGGHYLVDIPGGLACWALFFLARRSPASDETSRDRPALATA